MIQIDKYINEKYINSLHTFENFHMLSYCYLENVLIDIKPKMLINDLDDTLYIVFQTFTDILNDVYKRKQDKISYVEFCNKLGYQVMILDRYKFSITESFIIVDEFNNLFDTLLNELEKVEKYETCSEIMRYKQYIKMFKASNKEIKNTPEI